jgi:hypothetical protein
MVSAIILNEFESLSLFLGKFLKDSVYRNNPHMEWLKNKREKSQLLWKASTKNTGCSYGMMTNSTGYTGNTIR